MRATPVDSMRHPIRPQNGPFWAVSMQDERKPVEASFPLKNAKKRHLRRHARNEYETHACLFHPRGESGESGESGELRASIARMKNIRPHRSGWRVEFSFGITSHKNYYVNSRVKNKETSAFETN